MLVFFATIFLLVLGEKQVGVNDIIEDVKSIIEEEMQAYGPLTDAIEHSEENQHTLSEHGEKLDEIEKKCAKNEEELHVLEKRVEDSLSDHSDNTDDLENKLSDKIDKLEKQFASFESMHASDLKKLEKKIAELEKSQEHAHEELEEVTERNDIVDKYAKKSSEDVETLTKKYTTATKADASTQTQSNAQASKANSANAAKSMSTEQQVASTFGSADFSYVAVTGFLMLLSFGSGVAAMKYLEKQDMKQPLMP